MSAKIKIKVKYYDEPIKVDKEKHKAINYVADYMIPDDDKYIERMQKEIEIICKKYKGIYSIKFYIHN